MKKKLFLLVIASFMFIGVVSAASLWGTYKGNQIIRLTVDGVPVKVLDAPVVSMDGRTMIPIYLLKGAGINYTWDQKNQTVNILSKKVEDGTSVKDILILFAEISDYYNRLSQLGDMLWESGDRILDAKTNIDLGFDPQESTNHAAKSLELRIKVYDSLNNENQTIIDRAKSMGFDISNTATILSNYYSAMDHYIKSLDALKDFVNTQNKQHYDSYMNNLKLGDSATDSSRKTSSEGYKYFINRIINTK